MAAVTTAVLAASALAYSVYSGERARKEASEQQKKSEQQAARVQAEADQSIAVSDGTAEQQKARARQKTNSLKGSSGAAPGTVIPAPTSSTGGFGSYTGKTLLGS